PNTSPPIAVNPSQLTQATGGSAISADGTGGTFTTLTGPTYTETAAAQIGTGTIIVNSPGGFIFDTGGTAPGVIVQRNGSGGSRAINNVSGSTLFTATATTNQITFTVTSPSSGAT